MLDEPEHARRTRRQMKLDSQSQDTGASASAGAAMSAMANEPVIRISDRYEILSRQRFEACDRPSADVFRARRADQPQTELWAIASGMSPLARADILTRVKALDQPMLLALLDWAIVPWGADERRLALVFDQPPGPQLMKSMDEVRQPMGEEQIVRTLFIPAHAALSELTAANVFHGAIRPTNFYYDPSGRGAAVLGECVSSPPSFLQPAVCETIERAQAEPIGRGPGTVADDLYSLGVTAAIMALGQDPLKSIPIEAMLELKIERGTYAALLGSGRLPGGLTEPLRGLLSDDPRQRWTLDDLGKWLGGRRQNARQVPSARRAQRAIDFGGTEVWNPRSLAAAMSRSIPMAIRLIQSGEIDRWLRRSLGDSACAVRVDAVISMNSASGRVGGTSEERLVARVCMALDPAGPIRYRGRSVMPMGVGGALADAVARGGPTQPLAEIISSQLPLFWYGQQPEEPRDAMSSLKSFDQTRAILERPGYGHGLEGALYELVSWMPCASDMVKRQYVTTPSALLQALESAGGNQGKRPETPIDRHVAGFLIARDRAGGDKMFAALTTAANDGQKHLAMLNILAGIQRRFGPPSLPQLTGWIVGLMKPIIERLHSRKARERVQLAVTATAQKGDLLMLQQLVDDPETIEKDLAAFRNAQNQYARLAYEIGEVTKFALDRAQLEATVGRETAAVVSTGIALLLAAGIVLMTLAK